MPFGTLLIIYRMALPSTLFRNRYILLLVLQGRLTSSLPLNPLSSESQISTKIDYFTTPLVHVNLMSSLQPIPHPQPLLLPLKTIPPLPQRRTLPNQHALLDLRIFVPIAVRQDIRSKRALKLGVAKRVALQIQHVLLVLRIFVPNAVRRDIGKIRASKLGVAKKVALQIETGQAVFSMRRLELILLYLFTVKVF